MSSAYSLLYGSNTYKKLQLQTTLLVKFFFKILQANIDHSL